MKALKFALVALILASALSSLATDDKPLRKSKVTKISFAQAMQDPWMVNSMYAQLNSDFLSVEKPLYTCRVVHGGKLYYIVGTYEEWSNFFGEERKFVISRGPVHKAKQR